MSDTKPFVYATVIASRIVAESLRSNENFDDTSGSLEIEESGQIKISWEVGKDNSAALTISPNINFEISVAGEKILTYSCDYEVRFDVVEFHGFEAKDGLPQNAAAPYVDFAVYLTRQYATKSIRDAGLATFDLEDGVRSKDLPYEKREQVPLVDSEKGS
jgi:hypothetical protein